MSNIPLNQVEWNDELYPRVQWDWMTVNQYTDSLKHGARFPAILVAAYQGKLVGIDGRHRYEAHKRCKRRTINVEIRRGLNAGAIFALSVSINNRHGRKLSVQERTAAAHRLLKEFRFNKNDISSVMSMPWGKVQKLMSERTGGITFTGAASLFATRKAPLVAIDVDPADVPESQKTLASQDQMQIFKQALEILKRGHLDMYNAKLLAVVSEVGALIGRLPKKFKRTKKKAA